MKKSEFLFPAPENYQWPRCPDADRFIRERIAQFISGHAFARHLADRMHDDTSTEFQMWVDYLSIPRASFSDAALARIGFVPDPKGKSPAGAKLYWHPFADLPRLLVTTRPGPLMCAVMVDSISDFQLAHNLSLPIDGAPFSLYRESRLAGETNELRIIERRGTRAILPDRVDRAARYLSAVEAATNRPRRFASRTEGMKKTLALARTLARRIGEAPAAWAFMEAERRYWQSRNRAAQVQKSRQDRLGLGWANHDHHTFRSSRSTFPALVEIFLALGFKKRERYYAGAEAGWGAQVMEQPEARLIVFADVDLADGEIEIDFSSRALPDLKKPGTIGLWCALHGDSILESGMHHLEAKFDFDHLKGQLRNWGVNFMNPFSDFPHLRQAFSEGELWRVPAERLDALRASGALSPEAHERIAHSGAVGSHMENLQRRDGFKGFNQKAVSRIIREVNPESQAMRRGREAA